MEWDYIAKVLDVFKFGEDFKRWVKVFYTDISSCVINNGFASPFFKLERGVRQGCPLSGLLFVLAIELLALAIKNDPLIQGICVGKEEIKLTQYADDTTVFVKNTTSVEALLRLLEKFKECSGLEINTHKSEALWLGSWKERLDKPFGFKWPTDSVYALGIHFSNDANLVHKLNFHGKLEKLEKILNSWRRRKLTLYGKINIIKTLGLSKLIFSASVLPIPENFAQEVNKLTFKFLWDAKPAKIKKSTITGLKEKGGLKMIDFDHMNKALKCAWINRFTNGNKGAWKIIPDNTTAHLGGFSFLLQCNYKVKDLDVKNVPLFYERVLKYWEEVTCLAGKADLNPNETFIWNNRHIKINNKTLFFPAWFHKGIYKIKDLISDNGKFLPFDVFCRTFDVKACFTTYYGLCNSIRQNWNAISKESHGVLELISNWRTNNSNLTTADLLSVIADNKFVPPSAEQKILNSGVSKDNLSKVYLLPWSITKEIKLCMFQFKIIHNAVFTKDKLFKANILQDDKCFHCKDKAETLLHLLVHCPHTVAFWDHFREWWRKNTHIVLNLTPTMVLYGVIDNSRFCTLLNLALLVAKFYIYRCSLDDTPLYFPVFETELREKARIEKDIATRNGNLKHFKIKWEPLIRSKFIGDVDI